MASIIPVNGQAVPIDDIKTVGEVVPAGVKSVTVTANGGIKTISRKEAERMNLDDVTRIDTGFAGVEKGSSVRAIEYINKEIPSIANFLSPIYANNGKRAKIALNDYCGVAFLQIMDFPLPNRFGQNDTEDILLALPNYPSEPPHGIHIAKGSANKQKISDALAGHIFGQTMVAPQHDYGDLDKTTDWVCFHYENYRWNYDYNNPTQGDCLYKYLQHIWEALQ